MIFESMLLQKLIKTCVQHNLTQQYNPIFSRLVNIRQITLCPVHAPKTKPLNLPTLTNISMDKLVSLSNKISVGFDLNAINWLTPMPNLVIGIFYRHILI